MIHLSLGIRATNAEEVPEVEGMVPEVEGMVPEVEGLVSAGSGLNLLKETITNEKELYGRTGHI